MNKMKKEIPEGFEEAKTYIKENEQELREKYGESYIAIVGGCGIIDYDQNESHLLSRLESRTHTSTDILISTIDKILISNLEDCKTLSYGNRK